MRQFVAPLVLVPFVAFSLWVVADVGYFGLLQQAVSTNVGQQVSIDLVLACTMVLVFVHRDAKQRGVAFWPWVLLTVALGSIGPLAYFAYTGWRTPNIDT